MQTRDIEHTVVPVARELGVGIVPYSPLGRGFLADLATFENIVEKDSRRNHPRFSAANLEENMRRISNFYALAERRGCTPAQLALAWVHSQGEDVFPIPGTKSSARIEENAWAYTLLPLSEEEKAQIADSVGALSGERYPEHSMKTAFNSRV
ncbi:aldo/keto reductase [archaeon]|nr:MAG: aldo/keto reductase [archaeon]